MARAYSYSSSGRLRFALHPFRGFADAILENRTSHEHDLAGNRTYWTDAVGSQQEHTKRVGAYYYDAQQRLRAVDQRGCKWRRLDLLGCDNQKLDYPHRALLEEYRYDALGRRVVARSRADSSCHVGVCISTITRAVYDGDQVLYEIRYPGGDGLPILFDIHLARDTGFVQEETLPYGRVAYTHGPGIINRPLSVVRMNYSDTWPEPVAVMPHANWRGLYDRGSFANGTRQRCTDYSRVETCVFVAWPAPLKGIYFADPYKELFLPASWFGHLINQKTDATGLQYKRNRYYDPAEGRFTQEDPIGLAGGLNLYGFAAGDPVNLSDPFGLCPCIVPIAIGIFEIGSAIYDIYQAVKTHRDPNATAQERSESIHAAGAGAFLPGPGNAYGAAGKALAGRAKAIQQALPSVTQRYVTTAAGRVTKPGGAQGVLVASSEKALRPAQRAALRAGEMAVSGSGHAEMTLLRAADEMGAILNSVAVSRPICSVCAQALEAAGVRMLTPLK